MPAAVKDLPNVASPRVQTPIQPAFVAPRMPKIGDVVLFWETSLGKHDVPTPAIVMFVHDDGSINATVIGQGYVTGFQVNIACVDPKADQKSRMGRYSFRD